MVWFVRDPCGIGCAILAWLLMAFSHYVLLTIVLLPQDDSVKKYIHIFALEIFSFLALLAHLRTMLTDPGSIRPKPNVRPTPNKLVQQQQQHHQQHFVLNNLAPDQPAFFQCTQCWPDKQDRAYHCSICKHCIRAQDHHCCWINNCVGERNQKYFILFIVYIGIVSFHAFALTVDHLTHCFNSNQNSNVSCIIVNKTGRPSPNNLLLLVVLVFESLLFFLFASIMLGTQIRGMRRNKTLQSSHC